MTDRPAVLTPGDKLAIACRRLFLRDRLRFSIGTVEAYEEGIARVAGHSWIHDPFAGTDVRKESAARKVLSIVSGTLLVYVLPPEIKVDALHLDLHDNGNLDLCDNQQWRLNVSEATHGPGGVSQG